VCAYNVTCSKCCGHCEVVLWCSKYCGHCEVDRCMLTVSRVVSIVDTVRLCCGVVSIVDTVRLTGVCLQCHL